MNVLFEEDGAFKAGAVLADNDSSLQVELPTGKRTKVKSGNVLLRFAAPGAQQLLAAAETEAAALDVDFLWEVSGAEEFGFEDLAREYYGAAPQAAQSSAILLRLHSAPIHFHRKGRGRFRKAPPEILQAALAGLEKKRQQAILQERMAAELQAGTLPGEFVPLLPQLLYKPDRNRIETKALEAACAASGLSAARLLGNAGAFADTHAYHLGRFLFEHFPQGTEFAQLAAAPPAADLPVAQMPAFSIDDATTTEIDDAFSVEFLPAGGWRIGIHIAAPGLAMQPGSGLADIARARLSTVYFPGRKITMLPDAFIEQYTLAEGAEKPALSLYLEVAPDLRVLGTETRIERVGVAANLRHHDIEPKFNATTLANGTVPEFRFRDELTVLWRLAEVLEAGRGKASAQAGLFDFNYYVDWNIPSAHGPGHVDIQVRPRGSPLDKLVAELMIVANATWGAQLRDAGVAGIYRVQTAGKVRMSGVAGPHDGLGVDCYAWSSSPLRRYVDLLNQWQMLSLLRGEPAPFTANSEAMLATIRDFELTYAAYADFQRQMERYWCLRWLLQEGGSEFAAHRLREPLVRLEAVPLVLRCPSAPSGTPRSRLLVAVRDIDLFDIDAHCRFAGELATEVSPELDEEGVGNPY
ncbi:MAG: RNB domain-containing ribonuclease [Rhodocyclaceae bacterium]|nr:RNB domain-containing ribonuclease [Rhodocyclaceae bacterium]